MEFEFLISYDTMKAKRIAIQLARECHKDCVQYGVDGISACKITKRRGRVIAE